MPARQERALRWGLLGTGDIVAKRVAHCMKELPEVELVAACRRNEVELRAFAKKFQVPRIHTSIRSLSDDPEVEAVYVATPHHLHCRHVVALTRAGKHVLVEKPMAMTAEQCREMIAACRRARVRLGVAYFRRTLPLIQKAKRLLDEGALGRPVLFRGHYPSGVVDLPSDHPRNWLMRSAAGGGSLFGVGSHVIDLFLHFGGRIAEVAGAVGRVVTGGDADDMAGMVCRFRSGALGLMSCSYNSPSGTLPFEISGTEARLAFDAIPRGGIIVTRQGKTETLEIDEIKREDLDMELIRSFTRHVTDGAPFVSTGEDGMRTNVVMDALRDASRTRRWVTIDWDRDLSAEDP